MTVMRSVDKPPNKIIKSTTTIATRNLRHHQQNMQSSSRSSQCQRRIVYVAIVIGILLLHLYHRLNSAIYASLEDERRGSKQQRSSGNVGKATRNTNVDMIATSRKSYPTDAQMGTQQMDRIMSVLPPDGNLLVWGLGDDSPYWHHATSGKVLFLEDDFPSKKEGILWYDYIMSKYSYLDACKVHYTTKHDEYNFDKYIRDPTSGELYIDNFPKQQVMDIKWDVILIDAPLGWGEGDWGMGPGRYQSIYMTMQIARNQLLLNYSKSSSRQHSSSSRPVHVFVDDYERKVEREFSRRVFRKEPHQVKSRDKGVSNANEQAHFMLDATDCVIIDPAGCDKEEVGEVVMPDRQLRAPRGRVVDTTSSINTTTTEKDGSSKQGWTLLLTVNDGFYDFFTNWLAHYRKLKLNNMEVIVVAEDDKPTGRPPVHYASLCMGGRRPNL